MDQKYQVKLYYGYEEGECGIFHAFQAVAPGAAVDSDLIAENLAEQLDCTQEDMESGRFNHNSMYVDLPESLVKQIKDDAIKEYLSGKEQVAPVQELNTKICYGYADASNNKAWNEAVIQGVLTPEQKQVILGCLNEGEFFIPGAVGLDIELPWEYDPQEDHPFWRLYEDSFEETTRKPTVDMTAEALVAAFVACKDDWERLGVEYTPVFDDYDDEYEADSVLEVLQDAAQRSVTTQGEREAEGYRDLSI